MNNNTVVILDEHFNGNNLFVVSLIYEPSDKYWVNPYYFLLTFKPKGVIKERVGGQLIERPTYINDKRITFKRSVHNVQAMALAINEYARGRGKGVAEKLTYWSDPNKSAHSGPEKEKLKTLSITSEPNEKNPNELVVNITASQGSATGGKANSVTVIFSPWDALSLMNCLSFMIRLTRERRLQAGPRSFGREDEPTGTED